MDRRKFVLACVAAPLVGGCVRFHFVPGTYDNGKVVVARRMLEGQPYALVETPSLAFPIFVHRQSTGAYAAVLTRCMHRGCTVEPADNRLVCPCHGSEYTHLGEILKGPTEKPLIAFAVQQDEQNIYILDVNTVSSGVTGGASFGVNS